MSKLRGASQASGRVFGLEACSYLRRHQKPKIEPTEPNAHFWQASSYLPDRMMKSELQRTVKDTNTIMASPIPRYGLVSFRRGERFDSERSGSELVASR